MIINVQIKTICEAQTKRLCGYTLSILWLAKTRLWNCIAHISTENWGLFQYHHDLSDILQWLFDISNSQNNWWKHNNSWMKHVSCYDLRTRLLIRIWHGTVAFIVWIWTHSNCIICTSIKGMIIHVYFVTYKDLQIITFIWIGSFELML